MTPESRLLAAMAREHRRQQAQEAIRALALGGDERRREPRAVRGGCAAAEGWAAGGEGDSLMGLQTHTCHGCGGRGWVTVGNRAQLCPVCNGSGISLRRPSTTRPAPMPAPVPYHPLPYKPLPVPEPEWTRYRYWCSTGEAAR